ncbi:MAG: DUF3048 domain-containing protein [Candidatus Veblenbacteria bacterium]|nr:DUF3048 domain-containing protein [Candidatus Veblenbacteria bacterium]MDZ4229614.1 DUF3048 domain-containing protein [Candidatus Veblenbacteria bacterium]
MAKEKKTVSTKRTKGASAKTRLPASKQTTASRVPILSRVAPELKGQIVNRHAGTDTASRWWPGLAWFGMTMLGILVASGSAIWLSSLQQSRYQVKAALPLTTPPTLTARAPLTGLPVTAEAAARRPWVVVVENFVTVRPQSGLSAADIVFESPTEGGITRLLTIYQSQLPTTVGPVRSARSYFNDWARPFAPLYSHSGGSDRALQQLRTGYGGITDVNEFANGAAYERNTSLTPPHNLFTTPERFFSYAREHEFELESLTPNLTFATTLPAAPSTNSITLPYLPQEYEVQYLYQPTLGTYQRLVDGTTQLDATTNQVLAVKNVVVVFTDIDPIPGDPLLRVNLRTLGQGEARLYTGGKVYQGTWRKTTLDSMLEFVDANGQTLPLQPGNTWIAILDSSQAALVTTPTPTLAP